MKNSIGKEIVYALKRRNEALPGLCLGIILYGLLVEIIGLLLVHDKVKFSVGLLIGIGCAFFMALHIAKVLDLAVATEGHQPKMLAAKSVLRYLVVVIVFFVMMKLDIGNLFAAFFGVMGLKVSAYAQPLIYKMIFKRNMEEESLDET